MGDYIFVPYKALFWDGEIFTLIQKSKNIQPGTQ